MHTGDKEGRGDVINFTCISDLAPLPFLGKGRVVGKKGVSGELGEKGGWEERMEICSVAYWLFGLLGGT